MYPQEVKNQWLGGKLSVGGRPPSLLPFIRPLNFGNMKIASLYRRDVQMTISCIVEVVRVSKLSTAFSAKLHNLDTKSNPNPNPNPYHNPNQWRSEGVRGCAGENRIFKKFT